LDEMLVVRSLRGLRPAITLKATVTGRLARNCRALEGSANIL